MSFDLDRTIIDAFDARFSRTSAADWLRFQEFCSWFGVAMPIVYMLLKIGDPAMAFIAVLLLPNFLACIRDGIRFRRAMRANWDSVVPGFVERAALERQKDAWIRLGYLGLSAAMVLLVAVDVIGLFDVASRYVQFCALLVVAWGLRSYAVTVPPPPSEFSEEKQVESMPEPSGA